MRSIPNGAVGRVRRTLAGVGAALAALLVPAIAAASPPAATALVNVADTRGLDPGPALWIGQIYNQSYWLFGLLVVGLMVTMGLTLGVVFDRAIGLLGLQLGKLDHHE